MSVVILQQGAGLLYGAWGDLTDAGISPSARTTLKNTLKPLLAASGSSSSLPSLLAIRHIRGRRAGSLIFVDLTAEVPKALTVQEATGIEEQIAKTLRAARKEVTEVRVKFHAID